MPKLSLNPKKIDDFRSRIQAWGKNHIEIYPWRYRDDPYTILVSEFMLHRTQKDQAEKVYREFLEQYPTLEAYVKGDREKAQETLKPLGLNWRIEGMLDVLESLYKKHGHIPTEKRKLIKERNVGPYIAGATATFTTNQPHTLIDTNTVRVIGRVFGLNLEGEARRRKEVKVTIEKVSHTDNPRDLYYAIIDLAHKICFPKNPDCTSCPLLEVPCTFGNNKLNRP